MRWWQESRAGRRIACPGHEPSHLSPFVGGKNRAAQRWPFSLMPPRLGLWLRQCKQLHVPVTRQQQFG